MQSKDTPAQPQAFSFNAPLQNDVSPKGYQSFQCSTDVESLQRTKTNKHWLHEYSCSACTGFHGLSTRATLTTPPLSWFSTDTFSNVNSLCWMLGTEIKTVWIKFLSFLKVLCVWQCRKFKVAISKNYLLLQILKFAASNFKCSPNGFQCQQVNLECQLD